MSEYHVEGKELISVITKAVGIIALGEKAESNSITLTFHKVGIKVSAVNSAASYQADLAAKVITPTKQRIHILPELLLSYAAKHKTLVLKVTDQALHVSSGKNFNAQIFFMGNNEDVEIEKPEESDDINKIAAAAVIVLNKVSAIRNRTDASQPLGVMLEWGKGMLELTVGDSHHAVVIDYKVKEKHEGKITMDLSNLLRIMSVGKHFAATESRFIAWSDVEYLSIANQSESVFIADTARQLIKDSKKQTKVELETLKFRELVETLTSSLDETIPIKFRLKNDRILAQVRSQAGEAKMQIGVKSFQGKECVVNVAIHHLKDCLSTVSEKTMKITVFNNMVALVNNNESLSSVAAMASVGSNDD